MLASSNGTRLAILIVAAFCASCTSTIHKTNSFNPKTGVQTLAVDAKQRVVLFAKVPGKPVPKGETAPTLTERTSHSNGRTDEITTTGNYLNVTCAEPSPDALSALSTGVGAGLAEPKVAASFAIAQAESAGSMGLRTQSIQLLRDGMYRLCEGYAAGAIDGPEFNRQQRRYQNLMLSLLAIEQLTGAVTAAQIGLGEGSASGSVGDKADQAATNLATANAELDAAKKALAKAQETRDADDKVCKADSTSTSCKAAEDKAAVDKAQQDLDEATLKQKNNQDALLAARSSMRADAAGAKVKFADAPVRNPISEGSARYIAEATRTIVSTTLLASFAQEECTKVWEMLEKLSNGDPNIFSAIDGTPADQGNPAALKAAVQEAVQSAIGDAQRLAPGRAVPEIDGSTLKAKLADLIPAALTARDIVKDELVHAAKNCQANQRDLFARATLFSPQYDGNSKAPALKVLGSETPTPLAPKQTIQLIIVGGVPPYRVNDIPLAAQRELKAKVPTPNDTAYALELSRPDTATRTSGSSTVYVVDSTNAFVAVPVSFVGEAKPEPEPEPEPKPKPKPAAASVSSVTSKDGTFEVTFVPPPGVKLKSILGTATNTTKPLDTPLKSKDVRVDAKTLTLSGCADGSSYHISVAFEDSAGKTTTVENKADVACIDKKKTT